MILRAPLVPSPFSIAPDHQNDILEGFGRGKFFYTYIQASFRLE